MADKFCGNIKWILYKKGSQGQASRKSVSHFSFGKCFISWTSASSGISVSMQLSTIPLSIIDTVPIVFSAVISACENAKDTQSSWLTDVAGKVLVCTFTKITSWRRGETSAQYIGVSVSGFL